MNNVVLLYLKKVMNKLVSIHSDLTGGVLNIQSSLSDLSSDVTDISNIGILKSGSIYRSIQKGAINISFGISADTQETTKTTEIPISPLANLDKSNITLSNMKVDSFYILSYTVTLNNDKIIVTIKAQNPTGSYKTTKLTGNWRIDELY